MTITYHAGRRIQGTSTDATVVSGGWKEVGRTTLGSAGDTITVSSLADKRYYMVLGYKQSSGTSDFNWRVGNGSADSGNNYARRQSSNGGTDTTNTGYSRMFSDNGGASTPSFQVGYFANKSDKEKLNITHSVSQGTSGAGTAPTRRESVNKWTNTSNPIDVIQGVNVEGGDFASGSEVVVLGWDEDDTHSTNFWEELASVDLSGGTSTSLSTGTFTAKKYLWVQIFSKKETSGGIQPSLKVGTGGTIATGSPYAFRWSNDGATDPTPSVNLAMCPIAWLGANVHFSNTFIINNSGNEKLFINHSVANVTAGAGTAPQRVESVGKFANTSGQINIIDLYDWDSASLGTETIMKVWGSN